MKKVLVIDDESTMGNLIKMHLSDTYEIIEADDGIDAVEMAEGLQPYLVILNKKMLQKGIELQCPEESVISVGEMVIDQQLSEVYVKGNIVDLTPKEFNLLKLFVINPRKVFSRDTLLYEVWGIKNRNEKRTVDTHIKTIREKFRKSNLSFNPIKTVWGVGYRFDEPVKDIN